MKLENMLLYIGNENTPPIKKKDGNKDLLLYIGDNKPKKEYLESDNLLLKKLP